MPQRHGAAGRRLIRELMAELEELGLEPDAREWQRLHAAADLADLIEKAKAELAGQGLTVTSASGAVKAHPLVPAIREMGRQQTAHLDKINMEATYVIKDAAKQRAAQARWTRERARRATS